MANIAAFIRHIIINEKSFIFNRKTAKFYTFFMKKVQQFPVLHAIMRCGIQWRGGII